MERIPVYFMPGLAAGPSIFQNISLPETAFEMIFLEWEIPYPNETLKNYAKRICKKILHQKPVLIGVSFGGILVQEMAQFIDTQKIIIISSVTSNRQFPLRMKMAKFTKAYRLIPMQVLLNAEHVSIAHLGKLVRERLELYRKYLHVRDIGYLRWAIGQVINWDRSVADARVVHIHGDSDEIFPAKYLGNHIAVAGGTHIMILNKFRWLNENLPKIIMDEPWQDRFL